MNKAFQNNHRIESAKDCPSSQETTIVSPRSGLCLFVFFPWVRNVQEDRDQEQLDACEEGGKGNGNVDIGHFRGGRDVGAEDREYELEVSQ